ncbi:DUF5412 domain-containing protein [Massilia sp. P8910]|uniref:DUF5412 domain-containing protein n=1 Tax=Massilia antarctica TaxID=2765360 RepID=UPI001E5BF737|nr:DUF5412 domain-containing protein [Massilia antarctica]MCE3604872.1 DUF5412 domain-containing protein [Massilia antarctica]
MMRSLVILVLASSMCGCLDLSGPCGNEVLSESTSPSGHTTVTTFRRNCGATTGYVNVVSVRSSSTAFDGEDKSTYVLMSEAETPVTASWESHGVLRIRRSAGKSVFLEIRVFDGMQIRYNDEPI